MNAIALKLPNGQPSSIGICQNCGWTGEMQHAERCCTCATCGKVVPKTGTVSWCGEHDTCQIKRERSVVKNALEKLAAMSDQEYFDHYSAQELARHCGAFLSMADRDRCEKKIRH